MVQGLGATQISRQERIKLSLVSGSGCCHLCVAIFLSIIAKPQNNNDSTNKTTTMTTPTISVVRLPTAGHLVSPRFPHVIPTTSSSIIHFSPSILRLTTQRIMMRWFPGLSLLPVFQKPKVKGYRLQSMRHVLHLESP